MPWCSKAAGRLLEAVGDGRPREMTISPRGNPTGNRTRLTVWPGPGVESGGDKVRLGPPGPDPRPLPSSGTRE